MSPKEVTLVITDKSSVKDEGEKLFRLTKRFLKNTLCALGSGMALIYDELYIELNDVKGQTFAQ